MPAKFDTNKPIYQQIIDRIKRQLVNGGYPLGSKIPSVRELALYFEVNPNTVQRALAELERIGYLVSERTQGRYVTQDLNLIEGLKAEIPMEIIKKFICDMAALDIGKDEIIKYVSAYMDSERTEL